MSLLDALPAQRLWEMSDEEFWAYARELASGGSSVPVRVGAGQYLEITLSQRTCLLPLSIIEEVLQLPSHYALLPSVPGWMPGLAAWRGEVLAVVDLEMYLGGHHSSGVPSGGLLLCLHYGELAIGLYVLAVGETIMLDESPDTEMLRCAQDDTAGFDREHSIPVLDCEALLADVARQIGMAAHDV
jgi:chemotaxis signal transduction protein